MLPSLLVTGHLGSVTQDNSGSLALHAAALVLRVHFEDHARGAAVVVCSGRPRVLALPQDKVEDLANGNWLQHTHKHTCLRMKCASTILIFTPKALDMMKLISRSHCLMDAESVTWERCITAFYCDRCLLDPQVKITLRDPDGSPALICTSLIWEHVCCEL